MQIKPLEAVLGGISPAVGLQEEQSWVLDEPSLLRVAAMLG